MPVINPERLAALQRNAHDVRNICILAHVDHGKTSLSDALIATNGIISPKMAGKVRYLDSRPDEQLRGITMESSAISLSFSMARRQAQDAEPLQKEYLINLIDSPGHVDFSSEVSTASRLCDGALVLVDAVEGVCSQTVTVLRQAWMERIKPLLVINKIDRLVWELKMTSAEAYTHLNRLVEEVNAVLGSFFQGERMEEDLLWREKMEQRITPAAETDQDLVGSNPGLATDVKQANGSGMESQSNKMSFEEKDDEAIYFAPENNNIIFSSAVDNWAFTIRQFAALYEKKLGIDRTVLEKVLWGDYYLDPKTKRVLSSKHLKGRSLKPMFVQLVLDNIWAVYSATTGGQNGKGDPTMLEKITKSLSITIPPHILRSRDTKALMTAVFSAWLPLSTAVLVSVVEQIPSPPHAQSERLAGIIYSTPGSSHVSDSVRTALTNFTTSETAPAVAYVSKMVSVAAEDLPENRRKAGSSLSPEEARELAKKKRAETAKARAAHEGSDDGVAAVSEALSSTTVSGKQHEDAEQPTEDSKEPEQLVGFARLYSGTFSVGDSVYVLQPKFNPADPHAEPLPTRVTISALYMLMGRSLESLQSVPAGVVFGIGGLGRHILKTGTLSSVLDGAVNLAGVTMGGQPIVRVALEPSNPADLGRMVNGMKLLEQSDPCAQYETLESGEHVIATAGELHLERCLKDLRERFARCDIQAGEPIVPYRETIVAADEMTAPKSKDLPRGVVLASSSSQNFVLRLRVRPMPKTLAEFIAKHANTVRNIYASHRASVNVIDEQSGSVDPSIEVHAPHSSPAFALSTSDFYEALQQVVAELDQEKESWADAINRALAFGPRRNGPNILVDTTKSGIHRRFFDDLSLSQKSTVPSYTSLEAPSDLVDRIIYAFQLATGNGPLCHEPMYGVAVFLEDFSVGSDTNSDGDGPCSDHGRLTGEVLRVAREAIREGFLDWSPRLMLAIYSCEIQAPTEVLGRVYGVITRRRGRILSEALNEGTPFFTITSVLPVAESFGFSDEIRKRTSGGASPQLRFHGFDLLDLDPFWVPFTEDELEDLGELADKENVAKRYMDAVRRRKGLLIKGTRTMEGEKARTLKK